MAPEAWDGNAGTAPRGAEPASLANRALLGGGPHAHAVLSIHNYDLGPTLLYFDFDERRRGKRSTQPLPAPALPLHFPGLSCEEKHLDAATQLTHCTQKRRCLVDRPGGARLRGAARTTWASTPSRSLACRRQVWFCASTRALCTMARRRGSYSTCGSGRGLGYLRLGVGA